MSEMLARTAEKLLSLTVSMAPSDARDIVQILLRTALDPEDEALVRRIADVISIGMEGIPLGDQPTRMYQGILAVALDTIESIKAAAQGEHT